MEKKVLLGVDEITLVILPLYGIEILKWEEYAENIILNFITSAEIETIFDSKLEESTIKRLSGYNLNYNLGITDYYFCIAYNTGNSNMGVCVKFSAKAWAIYQARYQKLYNKQLLLSSFLKKIDDNTEDEVRLSRIDLTADYINYGLDLNILNESISSNEIIVQDDSGQTRLKSYETYSRNDRVETIYLGSRKKNTNGFLRVYDKWAEQTQNNGFRMEEALKYREWIRFEAVFKGKYAHIIAQMLINNTMTSYEFTKYIAKIITQKYRFLNTKTGEYADFTKDLLELAKGCGCDRLRSESPRDNALRQNIAHILHGSGLFPTVYKIEHLYGKKAIEDFIDFLRMYYCKETWLSRTMYKELNIWLKKHSDLKNVPLGHNFDQVE